MVLPRNAFTGIAPESGRKYEPEMIPWTRPQSDEPVTDAFAFILFHRALRYRCQEIHERTRDDVRAARELMETTNRRMFATLLLDMDERLLPNEPRAGRHEIVLDVVADRVLAPPAPRPAHQPRAHTTPRPRGWGEALDVPVIMYTAIVEDPLDPRELWGRFRACQLSPRKATTRAFTRTCLELHAGTEVLTRKPWVTLSSRPDFIPETPDRIETDLPGKFLIFMTQALRKGAQGAEAQGRRDAFKPNDVYSEVVRAIRDLEDPDDAVHTWGGLMRLAYRTGSRTAVKDIKGTASFVPPIEPDLEEDEDPSLPPMSPERLLAMEAGVVREALDENGEIFLAGLAGVPGATRCDWFGLLPNTLAARESRLRQRMTAPPPDLGWAESLAVLYPAARRLANRALNFHAPELRG